MAPKTTPVHYAVPAGSAAEQAQGGGPLITEMCPKCLSLVPQDVLADHVNQPHATDPPPAPDEPPAPDQVLPPAPDQGLPPEPPHPEPI